MAAELNWYPALPVPGRGCDNHYDAVGGFCFGCWGWMNDPEFLAQGVVKFLLGELVTVLFGEAKNNFTRLFEHLVAKFGIMSDFVDKFLGTFGHQITLLSILIHQGSTAQGTSFCQ
jgi:hypothetical protein